MLQAIREKAQGWIAWAIVIFISIPFALWGIQEYIGTGADEAVATVEGQEISEQDLADSTRRYREQLRTRLGAAYKAELFSEDMLRRQVLDQMIDERVLQATAVDWGMRASNQMVVDTIASERAFQTEGRFDHQLYTTVLRNNGLTEAGYEASVRQGLAMDQLQNGVAASSFATKAEVDAYQKLLAQKRTLSYVVITADQYAGQVKPDDASIQAYFDANRTRYQVPEQVKLDYLMLDVASLSEAVKVTDAELASYFEQHRDEFVAAEERKLRHILIPIEGDDTKALAKAQALRAQLAAGADFADLAKANSADPGSAQNGGELGWVSKGMMVGPFETAAFSLAEGAVSEPVKSDFGYHLIQLEGVRGGGDASLDQVRDKVAEAYRKSEVGRDFYERSERLAELAYENPDNLVAAADELGLTIRHSDWISRSGGAGDLALPKVTAAAFSEDVLQGNNSELLELGPEKLMVLRVAEHQEARPQALEEVRDQVVAAVRREQAADKAKAEGEAALARLKGGAALAEVAQAGGWTLVPSKAVGRDDNQVPLAIRQLAFRLARPEGGSPVNAGTVTIDGGYALVALDKVEDGDPASLDETGRQLLASRLAGMTGQVELVDMVRALREQADVSITLNSKPADE